MSLSLPCSASFSGSLALKTKCSSPPARAFSPFSSSLCLPAARNFSVPQLSHSSVTCSPLHRLFLLPRTLSLFLPTHSPPSGVTETSLPPGSLGLDWEPPSSWPTHLPSHSILGGFGLLPPCEVHGGRVCVLVPSIPNTWHPVVIAHTCRVSECILVPSLLSLLTSLRTHSVFLLIN